MEYETIVREANGIFKQYQMALTLRQLFYRLVAKHIIPNTRNSYNYLSKLMVRAREEGRVDEDYLEDRTRTTIGGDYGQDNVDDYLDEQVESLKDCWRYYTLRMWDNQNTIVECWVEKDALSRVVSDTAEGFRTITCPSKGYSSYSYIRDAVKRMEEYDADKDIWILYLGDYDPSGKDIERDLTSRLRRYHAPPNFMGVKRVALTVEQIREYELPPMMAKRSDPRFAKFVADTGGADAVELDALEPPILQKLVKKAITEYIDVDEWKARLTEIKEAQEELKKKLENLKISFD